jgi:hypothetical protein
MSSSGSNPYVLGSVLGRLAGLEAGGGGGVLRVETLELSVGSLYVGTSGKAKKYRLLSRVQG